jgi:hypothetical protein
VKLKTAFRHLRTAFLRPRGHFLRRPLFGTEIYSTCLPSDKNKVKDIIRNPPKSNAHDGLATDVVEE